MCTYISIFSNGYTHSLMIHSVQDHRPLFSLLALILIFNQNTVIGRVTYLLGEKALGVGVLL